MAGFDPAKYDRILKWPVRDGLLAYSEILADDALEAHRWNVLYAAVTGGKKPTLPSILKARGTVDG